VVVDQAQDARRRAVGQGPLGPVELPARVRCGVLEAVERGPGPLLWFWGDQPFTDQDAVHGPRRGHRDPGPGQPGLDGAGPVIPALAAEPVVLGQDHRHGLGRGGSRAAARPRRARQHPWQALVDQPSTIPVERVARDAQPRTRRRHARALSDRLERRDRQPYLHRNHPSGHGSIELPAAGRCPTRPGTSLSDRSCHSTRVATCAKRRFTT